MNAPHQAASVADLYKIDLDRYLFAPAPRRARARQDRLAAAVRESLRAWLGSGWIRWKEVAQAYLQ